jgi:hypothetical protein
VAIRVAAPSEPRRGGRPSASGQFRRSSARLASGGRIRPSENALQAGLGILRKNTNAAADHCGGQSKHWKPSGGPGSIRWLCARLGGPSPQGGACPPLAPGPLGAEDRDGVTPRGLGRLTVEDQSRLGHLVATSHPQRSAPRFCLAPGSSPAARGASNTAREPPDVPHVLVPRRWCADYSPPRILPRTPRPTKTTTSAVVLASQIPLLDGVPPEKGGNCCAVLGQAKIPKSRVPASSRRSPLGKHEHRPGARRAQRRWHRCCLRTETLRNEEGDTGERERMQGASGARRSRERQNQDPIESSGGRGPPH